MSGQFRHDVEGQRAQQYMINCTDLDPKDTIIYWANRTYSQTGFQVEIWEHYQRNHISFPFLCLLCYIIFKSKVQALLQNNQCKIYIFDNKVLTF